MGTTLNHSYIPYCSQLKHTSGGVGSRSKAWETDVPPGRSKTKTRFLTGGDVTVPVAMLTTFWSTLLHPYT